MGTKETTKKRACKLEPVGLVYNVDKKMLERETKNAITDAGVENVAAVKAIFDEKGRVSIYAFIKTWSNVVQESKVNAPKNLAYKIEGNGKARFTEEGREMLDFVSANNPRIGLKGNEMYIELNVFKCLAEILDIDPREHRLFISEVARTNDNRTVMTVITQNVESLNDDHNDDDGNNYGRFIEKLESRGY